MGKYKIPPDAWRQATLALLRYYETREDIEDHIKDIISGEKARKDPTPAAVDNMMESRKYNRMKRELAAVEKAIEGMPEDQLIVIRKRFWEHKRGYRHTCPYRYINAGYSEATLKRIIGATVERVARNLGEI